MRRAQEIKKTWWNSDYYHWVALVVFNGNVFVYCFSNLTLLYDQNQGILIIIIIIIIIRVYWWCLSFTVGLRGISNLWNEQKQFLKRKNQPWMYGPAAYPNETASRNVKMGIRFCATAVNKGDVNHNPARNSCCEPTILHHHHPHSVISHSLPALQISSPAPQNSSYMCSVQWKLQTITGCRILTYKTDLSTKLELMPDQLQCFWIILETHAVLGDAHPVSASRLNLHSNENVSGGLFPLQHKYTKSQVWSVGKAVFDFASIY